MAYTKIQIEDMFSEIISHVKNGTAVRSVLSMEGMPSSKTFYKWLDEDEEKVKRYARACEYRAEVIFEEILTIADKQDLDVKVVDGVNIVNHNIVNRNRLQVDARKWVLAKMQPKKYGDKLDLTSKDEPISGDKTTIVFKGKK